MVDIYYMISYHAGGDCEQERSAVRTMYERYEQDDQDDQDDQDGHEEHDELIQSVERELAQLRRRPGRRQRTIWGKYRIVRLPLSLDQRLEEVAAQRGIPVVELVRITLYGVFMPEYFERIKPYSNDLPEEIS